STTGECADLACAFPSRRDACSCRGPWNVSARPADLSGADRCPHLSVYFIFGNARAPQHADLLANVVAELDRKASCRGRGDVSVTGVRTCALRTSSTPGECADLACAFPSRRDACSCRGPWNVSARPADLSGADRCPHLSVYFIFGNARAPQHADLLANVVAE